jgi:hypothetical protein
MLARGWLSQAQYHVLRLLGEFGAYSQHVRLPGLGPPDAEYGRQLATIAGEMLELQMSLSVTALMRNGVSGADLPEIRRHLHREFPIVPPVIGLWSRSRCCLNVVEGSHAHDAPDVHHAPDLAVTGVDYEFGDESLLWINLDTHWSLPINNRHVEMTVFIPSRNDPAME